MRSILYYHFSSQYFHRCASSYDRHTDGETSKPLSIVFEKERRIQIVMSPKNFPTFQLSPISRLLTLISTFKTEVIWYFREQMGPVSYGYAWGSSIWRTTMSTSVPGSGETNPGVRPASVVTVPLTRHRLDWAHPAPGDSYDQRHEGTSIWTTTTSTESFFSRAAPSS